VTKVLDIWEFARDQDYIVAEGSFRDGQFAAQPDLPPDLVDYLKSAFPCPPDRRPGGWTVAESARVWGIQVAAARNRCNRMTADGRATVETCWIAGQEVNVYYPVEAEHNE